MSSALSQSHQSRVDNEPPLAIHSRLRCFHVPLDLFCRQVGGCTCDPCHSTAACTTSPEFGIAPSPPGVSGCNHREGFCWAGSRRDGKNALCHCPSAISVWSSS